MLTSPATIDLVAKGGFFALAALALLMIFTGKSRYQPILATVVTLVALVLGFVLQYRPDPAPTTVTVTLLPSDLEFLADQPLPAPYMYLGSGDKGCMDDSARPNTCPQLTQSIELKGGQEAIYISLTKSVKALQERARNLNRAVRASTRAGLGKINDQEN